MSRTIRPIRIKGDIAYITLTQGYEAVIDAADVLLVAGFNWHAKVDGRTVYARRAGTPSDGQQNNVHLHRVILSAPDSLKVDHRNTDGLDNRRTNLRLATHAQNQHNRRLNTTNTSGVKGVRWNKPTEKWLAQIKLGGKQYHLGSFSNAADAAAAYAAASTQFHGDFGRVIASYQGEALEAPK